MLFSKCKGYLKPTTNNLNFVRHMRVDEDIRNTTKFALINYSQKYDVRHIPKYLFNDRVYYNYPMEIDPLGARMPGFWFRNHFKYIKEMEPELIVPDLEGFNLKPYVSYRTKDIDTPEFTARQLFDHVYAGEIVDKMMKNEPVEVKVNEEEVLEAKLKALRPNADLMEPNLDELNYFHFGGE